MLNYFWNYLSHASEYLLNCEPSIETCELIKQYCLWKQYTEISKKKNYLIFWQDSTLWHNSFTSARYYFGLGNRNRWGAPGIKVEVLFPSYKISDKIY